MGPRSLRVVAVDTSDRNDSEREASSCSIIVVDSSLDVAFDVLSMDSVLFLDKVCVWVVVHFGILCWGDVVIGCDDVLR